MGGGCTPTQIRIRILDSDLCPLASLNFSLPSEGNTLLSSSFILHSLLALHGTGQLAGSSSGSG